MKRSKIIKNILAILLFACSLYSHAQQPAGQVELFCGADLKHADVNFIRLYDILINLTPGVKWHLGKDWTVSGQAMLPIINNGYLSYTPDAKRYEMIRLSNASVAKELHFDEARQHLKISAGLFGLDRWGGDLKWMMPVNDWLLLQAQAGLTNRWALGFDLHTNSEGDFGNKWIATGIVGANIYLKPWDTEFRVSAGRYINKDYGAQLDVMRHFRHCTILAYAQLHERGTGYADHLEAGGFKVIMMLPPYKKYDKEKVVFRPASNFRLTYNAQSDGVSMKMYTTDPEENERELPIRMAWGVSNSSNLNEK